MMVKLDAEQKKKEQMMINAARARRGQAETVMKRQSI